MARSKAAKAESHDRILQAAAARVRESGVERYRCGGSHERRRADAWGLLPALCLA